MTSVGVRRLVLARGELDRLEGPGYAARRAELRRKAKEAERTRERQAAAQDEAEENDATEEEVTRERLESDGRKNTPLLCLTLAMASLGVSWAGRLRVRHSHDGLASGRASETRGCPLAGRDLHGNPLHTDLCFWRLLLALCAIATPEAVLGECVAVLLRQWIEPRRRLHR